MIITTESIADYHANNCVSHTMLKDFATLGPAGYYHRHVRKDPEAQRPTTDALTQGQRFEAYLDGELDLVVAPEELPDEKGKMLKWHGNRKVCKQWLLDHPDAVSAAEAAMYRRMRESVMANATARDFLERAERQITFRESDVWDFDTQARPDYVIRGDGFTGDVLVDLKTCENLDTFHRNVYRYGYRTQAGMACWHAYANGYRAADGVSNPAFYLLAVEKLYPTRAVLYPLSERTVETGWQWCMGQLNAINEHMEAGHWPSTVSDVGDVIDAPMEDEAA
jgi:hypothetical protein